MCQVWKCIAISILSPYERVIKSVGRCFGLGALGALLPCHLVTFIIMSSYQFRSLSARVSWSLFLLVCDEEGEGNSGEGEVQRELSRKQRELCKMIFDTRWGADFTSLLQSCGLGFKDRRSFTPTLYRCSIEPEDIPFQGMEGGVIIACLLEVKV